MHAYVFLTLHRLTPMAMGLAPDRVDPAWREATLILDEATAAQRRLRNL